MDTKYDVVVIGAGSAGLTAAVGFSKVGKKVLLIEKEHMGGECTNTGCIPSKALLHHAKTYHQAVELAGGSPRSNTYRKEAFSYVRDTIQQILNEETPAVFEKMGIDVVLGEAEFVAKCSVQVGETIYSYKHAIIATGSQPRLVEVEGLKSESLLTNQNLFDLNEAPDRLLILGAGPIGLEMGQVMAMLGSRVTIATIGAFAEHEDEAIRKKLRTQFEALNITIHEHAKITRVEHTEALLTISYGDTSVNEVRVSFDNVLMAVGRTPHFPTGLEAAGIEFDERCILVDSQHRTSNKYVYAVGDVAQKLKFTHTADDTARQVVARVTSKGLFRVNKKKAVPKVTYTSPEIAQVGLSYDAAVKKYGTDSIKRIEVPFTASDRAKTDNATDGLLIVIARRLNGAILGAHIIGPRAGEIITTFTLAIDRKISLWKLQNLIVAYPTYSLVVKKAGDYFVASQFASLKTDLTQVLVGALPKIFAGLLWASLLIAVISYQKSHGMSVLDTSLMLFDFITSTIWGPLLYILAYTFRPLLFFPGTFLTILSGVFFGLWGGIVYTVIGANLSAALAYAVGRFFSSSLKLEDTVLGNWVHAFRNEPFTSTLIGRLIFLPFDLVNYAGGILKLPFWSYLSATIIGTLLGIATFVSVGASLDVEELRMEGITNGVIDPQFIGLSVVIFSISLGVSKLLKRWKAETE